MEDNNITTESNISPVDNFADSFANDLFPDETAVSGESQPETQSETPSATPEPNLEQPGAQEASATPEPHYDIPKDWPKEEVEAFNSLDAKGKELVFNKFKKLESGFHSKSQEMAKEREKLYAFQGLVEEFQNNKDFANHILSYKQKQKQAQNDNYGLGERPNDPYEAIKWDAAYEAKKTIHEELLQRDIINKQKSLEDEINYTINFAKTNDPEYYDKVQDGILGYIKSLPDELQEQVYNTLNTNPSAYKKMYDKIRSSIVGDIKPETKANSPLGVGKEQAPKAPLLEGGGAAEAEVAVKTRHQMKAEAKAQAVKGNWDEYLNTLAKDMFK